MTIHKWVKLGIVAGVIAAVAAVVGLSRSDSSSSEVSQTGTGNVNCMVDGKGNSVECKGKSPEQVHEQELIADAEEDRNSPPLGNGPWPFAVVRDQNIGLKVRTTNTAEGMQIGGLAHLHTAWAVCKQRSGFDPEGLGDLWYKIKWDNQQRSTAFFESETGATDTGWVISSYLVPVNHNGNIPDC